MKIIKTEDYVLLKNNKGEYHLSHDEFNKLGEKEAIKLAEQEIEKKVNSGDYTELSIDFRRAKLLGFCEFGIKDFCDQLNLDIKETYKIIDLQDKLTIDVLLNYTSECKKLFGKSLLDKFGGPIKLLEDNKTENCLYFILGNDYIPENELHLLACDFAESVLENFEKEYPDDNRPRLTIEAKRKFVKGEITKDELFAARSAARSAAWSATRTSAAESAARSAAESAARSAARSAESAARSAESAEIQEQIEKTLNVMIKL